MVENLEIPTEDLPLWMRQARRGVDWGVLIVMVFSSIAAWSFIMQPGLPRTNASENYVFRTADYAAAMQEGRLYPRWSPHVLNGYGAPIPNYYPPGAPYTGAVFQVLFTDNPVTAVRVVYALAIFAAGTATYVFVTRWSGAAAGVLASVLYIFSPYVGLVAPQILGDLPGVMGLALLPALLWAVSRLLQLNRAPDVLLVAAISGTLFLTDLRMAVVGTGFALVLIVWYGVSQRRVSTLLAFAACGLGVGLAAMYWLPALMEHDLVRWRAPLALGLPLRLTWSGLIAPLQQLDLAELVPIPPLTLGRVNSVFTILGVLGIMMARWSGRLKPGVQLQALFLVIGIGLVVVGVLLIPGEGWLLGTVMLALSVGGSAAPHLYDLVPAQRLTSWRHGWENAVTKRSVIARLMIFIIRPRVWQRLLLPMYLVLILIASLPVWISYQPSEAFGSVEPSTQLRYEQQGYGVAVLPPDAPVPLTIADSVPPNRFLITGYQTNNLNKIPGDEMSAEVRASGLAHQSHNYQFQLQLSKNATLDILTAYFPGWEASLDGKLVPLTPNEQNGLMRVSLPVNQNGILDITLNATPVRVAAWGMSWVVLALLLALTVWRFRRRGSHYDDVDLLSVPEARLVGFVLVCFVVVVVQGVLPGSTAPLRAHPGFGLDNSLSLQGRTEVGLEALSYRIDRTQYRLGETIDFTLYWRTLRFLPENYQVQVFLRDMNQGIPWLRTDFRYPGGYLTRRWLVNRYVTDPYHLYIPLSIVPGEYQIAVEVYACNPTCSPDDRLTFFSSTGSEVGQTLILPTLITLRRSG